MNLIISPFSDPYWNLAAEEILLKNSHENYLFLYINQPCVVVGKHQNTIKEINSTFLYNTNTLIARRLSGGGAVYHDEGNLNFSYIQSVENGAELSYRNLTQSILSFLMEHFPEIQLSDRNDLTLLGNKISGSAMHVYKNRVLAHGTLLINCDLNNLSAALKGNPDRFEGKSIESKRSPVMNLSEVHKELTPGALITEISNYLLKLYPTFLLSQLPTELNDTISELVSTKYSTPQWIYGYSPKYTYCNMVTLEGKCILYKLMIEKGVILRVELEQENELTTDIKHIFNTLIGVTHNINSLQKGPFHAAKSDMERQLLLSLI